MEKGFVPPQGKGIGELPGGFLRLFRDQGMVSRSLGKFPEGRRGHHRTISRPLRHVPGNQVPFGPIERPSGFFLEPDRQSQRSSKVYEENLALYWSGSNLKRAGFT